MATATKKCRVCGKEYEACRTLRRVAGVFRWQDVACSPECGRVYLSKVEASRAGITAQTETAANDAAAVEEVTKPEFYIDIDDEDDFDDLFEEDFDDDAE